MNRIADIHLLTKRLIVMTGVAILIFSTVFALSYLYSQRFMITWVGFLCGIIGGFVSIQQRMKTVSDDELKLLTQSWFTILLIPVFGGVFALVLYALFLSGIVSGTLFPAFYIPEPTNGTPDTTYMIEVFTQTYPLTGQDLAKLLFWSFVAGFSERFVPQIINNVSQKASDQTQTKDH
ncbi:hypothetical protein [Thiomicrorhabdus heinhorstiae]|uniref:DUF4199 domain-containing protein n=1 Tax=Thiomicrorhabdus heinhorstiae TaxID=2748010 RepID=A0ABS0BWH2_9GAMM|nr:hypothetical protein [Thiomicrorhabdus heinhorstiae]MBF6058120.1 hypothetical protein [Thiomicrorhabdus heinhorstiae]